MPYTQRLLSDIPFKYECIFCNYSTKNENTIINHYNTCKECKGHCEGIDNSIDYYDNFGGEMTLQEGIDQTKNNINITRDFIKTNELKGLEDKSFDDIINYIEKKYIGRNHRYKWIKIDCINIYHFFFGHTEKTTNILFKLVETVDT